METLEDKEETNVCKLTCDLCFKNYKERTGLWRHKKTCYKPICKSTISNNLATTDDILATMDDNLATNSNILATTNTNLFKCEFCNKEYQHRQGLWKHKKNCKTKEDSKENKKDEITDKELMLALIKDSSELKNMIMEVFKNGTTNHSHNTTHTNSHNKAFNLNFFLNETCKDAMNIMDFVDSIKLQLSDLEGVGELGYVEGISKIILKNLKELDVTQRPVHCTDKKRETMYIKDEDKWEKDEERLKLHKVVRRVTCKNQNLIPKFKEAHPDYNKYHSKFSDQFNKIIVESMGGAGDNDFEKEEKIIKNISKQVFIDKE
jgi:hypothetical protein